jgi:hypothetical protein
MAHLFAPDRRTDGYDVDGRLAPDSVWHAHSRKAAAAALQRTSDWVAVCYPKMAFEHHWPKDWIVRTSVLSRRREQCARGADAVSDARNARFGGREDAFLPHGFLGDIEWV